MTPNKQYLLVRINKEEQVARKTRIGSILLAQNFTFMLYNLQYGTIVGIGDKASKMFPEATPGDIAIFHHSVEEGTDRLLGTEDNGDELRVAEVNDEPMNNQVYAIVKPDGTIVPHVSRIFLHKQVDDTSEKMDSKILSLINDNKLTAEGHRRALHSNNVRIQNLKQSKQYSKDQRRNEEMQRNIEALDRDNKRLTYLINMEKLAYATVAYVNPLVTRQYGIEKEQKVVVGEADGLYPLYYKGTEYLLCLSEYVVGIVN